MFRLHLKDLQLPSPPSRYFAIGDIHGCATELSLLLKKLALRPTDCVVFLGDYVDRGAESGKVVDIILELQKQVTVIALRGNHEDMFMDFLSHPESLGAALFIMNGGGTTLASYGNEQGGFAIPDHHLEFFRNLHISFETPEYFFVHAGVPDLPLPSLSPVHQMQMLWIRSPFLSSRFDWGKRIIHGHSPVTEPELKNNRINVDTGCVYDGMLTAVELPAHKFYCVDKQKKDETPRVLRGEHESRAALRFEGQIVVTVSCYGQEAEFETLNYNQFGLLIRGFPERTSMILEINDPVAGFIGQDSSTRVQFRGYVARTEMHNDQTLYGIKIEAISEPGEGL